MAVMFPNRIRPDLIVLIAIVVAVVPSCLADFDPTEICTLIANGTMIKDPRACNTWIQCVDGTPISGTCPDQEFYDRETETCVAANSIECISSDPCAATAGENGFVADPYSCNGYYYCSNGKGSKGQCSTGMNFNPGTQDCIRNFPCTLPMDPDSYCNIVPDGVFIAATNVSCSSYEFCWNGELLNGTCPETFSFNAARGLCDYPKNVDCVESTSEPPTTLPVTPAEGACQEAGEFIADDWTCNGYYYCKAETNTDADDDDETSTTTTILTPVHAACPSGRFFDSEDGGACVPRTQIFCPYDRCAGLGEKFIQLANESNDGCVGFAVCQGGVRIGSGICPTGQYFDELSQLCTQTVISYPACALSEDTTTTTTITTTVTDGQD